MAIVISIVSLCICLAVALVFEKVAPHFKPIVLGIFVWWSFGIAVLTFHKPYIRTGNAYFACWFAWGGAGWLLMDQFPQIRGYADFASAGTSKETAAHTVDPTVFGNEGPSPIVDAEAGEAIEPAAVQPAIIESE